MLLGEWSFVKPSLVLISRVAAGCWFRDTALERPIMFGELRKIEERVGHDRFPLIAQNYYSVRVRVVIVPWRTDCLGRSQDYKQMTIAPPLPCVVKVSACQVVALTRC